MFSPFVLKREYDFTETKISVKSKNAYGTIPDASARIFKRHH